MSYSSALPRRAYRDWLTGLLLACVLAPLAVLSLAQRQPAPAPAASPSPVHVAAAEPPAPPQPPTVFDQEAAMSPNDLLKRWEPLVTEASRRFDVPADWIRAVIRMESGGRTMMGENQPITSDMGAMGIMQVLPQTYDDMRQAYRLGDDPYDPP